MVSGHLQAPEFAFDPDVSSLLLKDLPEKVSVWEIIDVIQEWGCGVLMGFGGSLLVGVDCLLGVVVFGVFGFGVFGFGSGCCWRVFVCWCFEVGWLGQSLQKNLEGET